MKLAHRRSFQAALCVLTLAQTALSHADMQAGALIAKNGTAGIAACMGCHGEKMGSGIAACMGCHGEKMGSDTIFI